MSKKNMSVIFLIHLLIGLYLINIAFSFLEFPEVVSSLDNIVIAIGGVLTVVGGINFIRAKKKAV